MEDTANPQGSESPAPDNIENAFAQYLERQANPAGGEDVEKQPAQEAENGQSDAEAKPEDAQPDEPEEQRYKVKVNGEEREVPLSELLKGYSLESDYRVKTAQVAEQARAAQAEAQRAQNERQQYAQVLQTYQQQLSAMQPQAPDPALIQSDPVSFLQQQQAYQSWQQQMQQVQYEQQALSQRQQAEYEQQMQQRLLSERDALLAAIPDWKDEIKAKAGKAELQAYLTKSGYTPDEVAQAADHRAIVLARKAMLYDQMIAKQGQATQKVASLPPKSPQRSGSGEISPTDGRTRHMQALKKTGSVEDAAYAFAAMLGGN